MLPIENDFVSHTIDESKEEDVGDDFFLTSRSNHTRRTSYASTHSRRPSCMSISSKRASVESNFSIDSRRPSTTSVLSILSRRESSCTIPSVTSASEKSVSWMKSLAKTDPRWNIMRYFQYVVMQYEEKHSIRRTASNLDMNSEIPLQRPGAFSVWRTTSMDAIRLMMTRKGTGKGLDIKGKSALRGKLSGFVPFVQIHNNDNDKKKVGTCPPNTRERIFFRSKKSRDQASVQLKIVMLDMIKELKAAKEAVGVSGMTPDEYEEALQKMVLWKMDKPKVIKIDNYAPKAWGVDIPERLMWETYVIRGNCTRVSQSDMDTGRPSEPQYFYMNLHALRDTHKSPNRSPRAVIWQSDANKPMDPMTLLMAYEEDNHVTPVVSDFDPFLVGTKGIEYKKTLPPDQVIILQWCVKEIEGILRAPNINGAWTKRWLRVLKKATKRGFYPEVPRYGYGDPLSYSIIENAVQSLKSIGAVRHGSECFNYYFPQALDEEFMIISPNHFSDPPYKYVSQYELQQFLIERVNEGFTFPLNPKWVLCDPGWINVWGALQSSKHPHVQESLNVWYPPESGVREKIKAISAAYPNGFKESNDGASTAITNTQDMDLAMLELKRFQTLQRAKKKVRIVLKWINLTNKIKPDSGTKKIEEEKRKLSQEMEELHKVKRLLNNEKYRPYVKEEESKEEDCCQHRREKRYELQQKEDQLRKIEQNLNAKRKYLEGQIAYFKALDGIRSKERQLEMKELDLQVKETRLDMLEMEMNLKLKKIIAQERGHRRKMLNNVQIELKQVDIWRRESELFAREKELNSKAEKLSFREEIVANEEEKCRNS